MLWKGGFAGTGRAVEFLEGRLVNSQFSIFIQATVLQSGEFLQITKPGQQGSPLSPHPHQQPNELSYPCISR